MIKLKTLEALIELRQLGYCNMLDKNCIEDALEKMGKDEIKVYIQKLNFGEYTRLIVCSLDQYIDYLKLS